MRTRMALGPRLRFGHADPAERRIDIEGIGEKAVGHLAVCALEEVRGDNLVVVVRGMGERAAAVAVAERPDVRDAGPECVIHHNVAARVDGDAGRVEAEVVGVRPAADREQDVRADNRGVAGPTIDAGFDIRPARGEADALGLAAHGDPLRLQNAADGVRHVRIFARNEPWGFFDHGHVGAEPAKNLGELEPDIAAADDHQMAGQGVEFEQRRVGQEAEPDRPRESPGSRRAHQR